MKSILVLASSFFRFPGFFFFTQLESAQAIPFFQNVHTSVFLNLLF